MVAACCLSTVSRWNLACNMLLVLQGICRSFAIHTVHCDAQDMVACRVTTPRPSMCLSAVCKAILTQHVLMSGLAKAHHLTAPLS